MAGACRPASTELTDAQREAIVSEVNQAVGELIDAMNAHDGDRVVSYYMNSADFAYVGVTDITVGWEHFANLVGPWYGRNTDVTFDYEVLHIQVLSPTVATVIFQGSSTEAEFLMWTQVLVRGDDGQWAIALEHESWPECTEPPRSHPDVS